MVEVSALQAAETAARRFGDVGGSLIVCTRPDNGVRRSMQVSRMMSKVWVSVRCWDRTGQEWTGLELEEDVKIDLTSGLEQMIKRVIKSGN